MRKYLLSFFIVLTGFVFVFLGLMSGDNKNRYAEDVFGQKAKEFESAFVDFQNRVKTETETFKNRFEVPSRLKDTLETRMYFLEKMNSIKALSTIGIFQERYKVVSKRDGASLVYALDSTDKMDVVRWRRFEKLKQVSSWDESFDQDIDGTELYKRLLTTENEIIWSVNNLDSGLANADAFLYCGYSFSSGDEKTLLIFQFSIDVLLEEFNLDSEALSPIVSLKTKDNETIEFMSDGALTTDRDSLLIALDYHFQRFEAKPRGSFNFSFEGETYWNSFMRFPGSTGLDHYLFTVNSKHLASNSRSEGLAVLVWMGGVLILVGLILLGIRKRFFYRANRMAIPDLETLLKDDENRFLEFKSSMRWDHRQQKVHPDLEKVILKTIAAFGNTDGGILLIGIDDDKNVVGLEEDFKSLKKHDSDYYEIHLRNVLHKAMGVKYVSRYIRTQFETLSDGKVVCKVKVIAGDEPLFLKFKDKNGNTNEKFFVRSGNSSHEIESIPEINDYINKKYKK